MLWPPNNAPQNVLATPLIFNVLERTGQIACFILPLLFGRNIAEQNANIIVVLMAICLAIYYIGWIRYLTGNRQFSLLFKPWGFIPIPMAVFPVLYFIFLGIWLESYVFLVPAIFLAIGHLVNSWHIYIQIKQNDTSN